MSNWQKSILLPHFLLAAIYFLAELEALEACYWLKATGFHEYVHLYDGMFFFVSTIQIYSWHFTFGRNETLLIGIFFAIKFSLGERSILTYPAVHRRKMEQVSSLILVRIPP